MKPRQLIPQKLGDQQLIQQINDALVEPLQSIKRQDLDPGEVFIAGGEFRRRDVGRDQKNRTAKEIYEFQREDGNWIRYTYTYTWNDDDTLQGVLLVGPEGNTVSEWKMFWILPAAGDGGPFLNRIEKIR